MRSKSYNYKHGALDSDALWILGLFILIFAGWWGSGGPAAYEAKTSATSTHSSLSSPSSSRTNTSRASTQSATSSPWYKVVRISSRGNAATEKWADFEYITLRNSGRTPVTISGWTLKNGNDSRVFLNTFDQLVYGASDSARIPNGIKTLLGTGAQTLSPIVLESGEQAIITSGKMTKQAGYLGASFKENICSGYLNELPGYALKPSLSNSCPLARNDADLDLLDDKCYTFIKSLRACHTPVYREQVVQNTGELRQYLDSTYGLSRQCRDFVQKRFTYAWCVLTHSSDKNFYRKQWRVYLGRRLQMWESGREHIRLYDANGLLVDDLSY